MTPNHHELKPLYRATGLFLVIIIINIMAVLVGNQGMFVFTLDDPYIHLALAENILQGHYGVNPGEYSAPASSVIWPFLVLPTLFFPSPEILILLVNVGLAIICIALFYKLIGLLEEYSGLPAFSSKGQTLFLCFFVLASNLVGLVFLGMEHVFQLVLVLLVMLGLLQLQDDKTPSGWFWFAVVLAPAVRYECLAISGAALLVCFFRGYYLKSVLAGFAILAYLLAFSFFLLSIGLDYMPSSVLVKSELVDSGLVSSSLDKLHSSIRKNYFYPQFWIMLIGMVLLIRNACTKRFNPSSRLLSGAMAMAVFAHLIVGRYGWFFRYEIYMWISEILVLFYLHYDKLKQALFIKKSKRMIFVVLLVFLIPLWAHIDAIFLTNPASKNIYSQQYQMHRFVTDYYKGNVAVNDIGWVSYGNDNYVLDLWGLASKDAREKRMALKGTEWMHEMAMEKDVGLVMMYKTWLPNPPPEWTYVGTLKIYQRRVTAGATDVYFYAVTEEAVPKIVDALEAFTRELPPETGFIYSPETW